MDNSIAFVKKLNEQQKDVHVTMTTVMACGAAWGLYKMRRDVGRLPWGTFKADKSYGVTLLVDVEGGKDLVPVTLWDGHKMTPLQVAEYINQRVQRAKKGKDDRHNNSTNLANFMPSFIAQPLMFMASYLAAVVGVEIKALSITNKAFGHLIVTNVGTLGYTSAVAPLCPVMHQMALLCTGAIQKRAVVDENDNIVIKKMMTCFSTGDHRYGDAAIFVPFFKTFRAYLEDPENFDEKVVKDVPHYSELKAQ